MWFRVENRGSADEKSERISLGFKDYKSRVIDLKSEVLLCGLE